MPKKVTIKLEGYYDEESLIERELEAALRALLDDVTWLHLDEHQIGYLTGPELKRVFAAVPKNVKSISFGKDVLFRLTTEDLVVLLSSLPEGIVSIDLSFNHLGYRGNADLVAILGAIQNKVTSIDLSGNMLHLLSIEELLILLKAALPHIKNLSLGKNQLFENMAMRTADSIFSTMQYNTKTLMFASVPSDAAATRQASAFLDLSNNGLSLLSCVLTPLLSVYRRAELMACIEGTSLQSEDEQPNTDSIHPPTRMTVSIWEIIFSFFGYWVPNASRLFNKISAVPIAV